MATSNSLQKQCLEVSPNSTTRSTVIGDKIDPRISGATQNTAASRILKLLTTNVDSHKKKCMAEFEKKYCKNNAIGWARDYAKLAQDLLTAQDQHSKSQCFYKGEPPCKLENDMIITRQRMSLLRQRLTFCETLEQYKKLQASSSQPITLPQARVVPPPPEPVRETVEYARLDQVEKPSDTGKAIKANALEHRPFSKSTEQDLKSKVCHKTLRKSEETSGNSAISAQIPKSRAEPRNDMKSQPVFPRVQSFKFGSKTDSESSDSTDTSESTNHTSARAAHYCEPFMTESMRNERIRIFVASQTAKYHDSLTRKRTKSASVAKAAEQKTGKKAKTTSHPSPTYQRKSKETDAKSAILKSSDQSLARTAVTKINFISTPSSAADSRPRGTDEQDPINHIAPKQQPAGDCADSAIKVESDDDLDVIRSMLSNQSSTPTNSQILALAREYKALDRNDLIRIILQKEALRASATQKIKIIRFLLIYHGISNEKINAFEANIKPRGANWDFVAETVLGHKREANGEAGPRIKGSDQSHS